MTVVLGVVCLALGVFGTWGGLSRPPNNADMLFFVGLLLMGIGWASL
jgi:hypothetical protein